MSSTLVWTSDTQDEHIRDERIRKAEEAYQRALAEDAKYITYIPVEVAPGDIDYMCYDSRTGEYTYG